MSIKLLRPQLDWVPMQQPIIRWTDYLDKYFAMRFSSRDFQGKPMVYRYRWQKFDTAPWVPLEKPLEECKVVLAGTSQPRLKDQPIYLREDVERKEREGDAKCDAGFREIPKDTPIKDVVFAHPYCVNSYDFIQDPNIAFPMDRFRELEEEGYIGELGPYFFGFSNSFDAKGVRDLLIPALVERIKRDKPDFVFLCPVCPLCNQTVGQVARGIEEAGIPTVQLGICRDVIESVKPPRGVFLNFPVAHNVGKPFSPQFQMRIIKDALQVLENSKEPGTLVDLPYQWSGNDYSWQEIPNAIWSELDATKHIVFNHELKNTSAGKTYRSVSFYPLTGPWQKEIEVK